MRELIQQRTKRLAVETIQFCDTFPQKQAYWIISKQLIRAATSVGANYRAVHRAKSKPDFINKLNIVEEEADETMFWLEILEELGFKDNLKLQWLKDEANQILSIAVTAKKTAKDKN